MPSPPLTIAYFTCRYEPKIEWFFTSLNRELNGIWDNINIIIIDYYLQFDENNARLHKFQKHYENYISSNNVIHISPKPSPLQGKYKISTNTYFCASNARNTAFIYCNTDYIACIDDLTVIKEGWLDVVRWGQTNNCIVYGSYAKVKKLSMDEEGKYTFDETSLKTGLDSRFNNPMIYNNFSNKVEGSWLFGCSFGLPLSLALTVDGFDETCDGMGAEDYDFGIRLGRITNEIYYSKQMFTYEDDDLHFVDDIKFIRQSKLLNENTTMKHKIGIMSDHAMLQNVLETNSTQPFKPSNLIAIRNAIQNNIFIIDQYIKDYPSLRDWTDGTLYSEM